MQSAAAILSYVQSSLGEIGLLQPRPVPVSGLQALLIENLHVRMTAASVCAVLFCARRIRHGEPIGTRIRGRGVDHAEDGQTNDHGCDLLHLLLLWVGG